MSFHHTNWSFRAIILLMIVSLFGCGGTVSNSQSSDDPGATTSSVESESSGGDQGSDSAVPASTTGSVALLLTDAPSDEFSEINLTINKIELLAADDGDNVTLFSGTRKVNLLGLRNYSNLFSINNGIAPGMYSKIRMRLDDVEFVRSDADGNVTETIHPKLVANGKLDLNPRQEFAIEPGTNLVIQLDMDAKKSVHLTGGGKKGKGKYIFRPVVFIDVVDAVSYGGKLVRMEGDVAGLNAADQSVELCNLKEYDGAECVKVKLNGATMLYDSAANPVMLEQVSTLERGIAIGYMNLESGASSMRAVAMELGPEEAFWHVSGDVTVPPVDDSNVFYFGIDPGQRFIAGTEFRVEPAVGAKLFSSDGTPLPWSAIATGRIVEIEGVLDRSTLPYTFIATVVYLDMTQTAEQLTGVVSNLDLGNRSFDVTNDEIGDRCVVAAETVAVYQVSGSGDSLSGERTTLESLQDGDSVELYGSFDGGGCFIADDILISSL